MNSEEENEILKMLEDIYISGVKIEPTFGETLIGVEYNLTNNTDKCIANQACASLADLANDYYRDTEDDEMVDFLFEKAISSILDAQMSLNKLLTFKK